MPLFRCAMLLKLLAMCLNMSPMSIEMSQRCHKISPIRLNNFGLIRSIANKSRIIAYMSSNTVNVYRILTGMFLNTANVSQNIADAEQNCIF